MRKLKLDSLNVQSFETTTAPGRARGTIQGHARAAPEGTGMSVCVVCEPFSQDLACQTYDIDACGDTQYLDCTLGCTDFASCQGPGSC